MKIKAAFWDTSAIIPLCTVQEASPAARRVKRNVVEVLIWWGTKVEMYSGFAKLKRIGEIDEKEAEKAHRKWQVFQYEANLIRPVDEVLEIAAALPGKYGLRSQDAFQLAAALVWCNELPRNRPFVCADKRLSVAAKDAGFDVVELL